MKRFYLSVFFFIFSLSLWSQTDSFPKNGLGLNLGSGVIGSFDYERIVSSKNHRALLALSLGAGIGMDRIYTGFLGTSEQKKILFASPHRLTLNVGNGNHFFEAGIGGLVSVLESETNYMVYPVVGYRFMGQNKSFFKFYLSYPMMGVQPNGLLFIPIGITIGQLF